MAVILKGGPVAQGINEKTIREIEVIKRGGINPTLGIIRVGQRPDDIAYENSVLKSCSKIGLSAEVFEVNQDITMVDFVEKFREINNNQSIHGILLFRPLPSQLDIEVIKNLISPLKDIDCMNLVSLGKTFQGGAQGFAPCTSKAIMAILQHYCVSLEGANAVIINSSLVVGRPLGMLMLDANATISICHSKTKDLCTISAGADIVVTAVGKAKLFGKEYFNRSAVVIDVGINDDGNGRVCGDVNYEEVIDEVQAITPVPGGVGTVTTAILLKHVVDACRAQTNCCQIS